MTAFVDTNVLVYLFDRDAPQKRAAASRLLERETVTLSTQVLQEFYVTVTRKLAMALTPADALKALERLVELPVVAADTDMVLAAAKRSESARISFWDALIVEAALAAGCSVLYTEDLQDGRRFERLAVQNPFAELQG